MVTREVSQYRVGRWRRCKDDHDQRSSPRRGEQSNRAAAGEGDVVEVRREEDVPTNSWVEKPAIRVFGAQAEDSPSRLAPTPAKRTRTSPTRRVTRS